MAGGRKWSQEEINYLKDNYPYGVIKDIANNLNRTVMSIKSQATIYKIKKMDNGLRITKRNIENNPMKNAETIRKAVESRRKSGAYQRSSERMRQNNPTKNGMGEAWKEKIRIASKKRYDEDPTIKQKLTAGVIKKCTGVPNGVFKKLNENPDFNKRRLKALIKKPTRPERIIADLIKENNLPFAYTGDGKVLIGNFNPDFLAQELNKVIEVNGIYWHNLPQNKVRDRYKYESYKRKGFSCLVLWEDEIYKDKNSCLNKIKCFMEER